MRKKRLNGKQKNDSHKNHQKTCLPCLPTGRRQAGDRQVTGRQKWEKPTLEDVSGKIMAQPYIRFT